MIVQGIITNWTITKGRITGAVHDLFTGKSEGILTSTVVEIRKVGGLRVAQTRNSLYILSEA